MIDPDVFVKAAKLIANEKEEFACYAIIKTSKNFSKNRKHMEIFCNIYEPQINNNRAAWLTELDDPSTVAHTKIGKTRRVLALLFAAEIARDGGIE